MTEQPAALSLEEQLRLAQEQIQLEKAGKRKLFHSLVKVANELRKTRVAEQQYQNQEQRHQQQYSRTSTSTWYEGGLWRAPKILPAVLQQTKSKNQSKLAAATSTIPGRLGRPAISLSDLFFHLVIVTAFTRVGVAIGSKGRVDGQSFLYFAMIFTVWHKESSYANRFDTTDLSAQITTLLTCFAVLFASLSVSAPLPSPDGTRIMATAAFVATLHCALHIRVAWTNCTTTVVDGSSSSNENKGTVQPSISDMCCCGLRSSSRHSYEATLSTEEEVNNNKDALIMVQKHVMRYAVLNSAFTAAEAAVWMVGILVLPEDWPYRWCLFTAALVLGLRVPRAFLVDDFHGMCRGVVTKFSFKSWN